MISKYLTALLHIAITLGGALGAAVVAPRDLSVWAQITVIALGAAVTYLVPLAAKKWQASLKVLLGAVLPGAVAAAIPFLPRVGHGFEAQNVLPLVVAVLAAVGAQVGVDVRTTETIPPVAVEDPSSQYEVEVDDAPDVQPVEVEATA